MSKKTTFTIGGPSMGPEIVPAAGQTNVSIRKPYQPTARHSLRFKRPTMTKQSHKDECDINTIMQRYEATGILSHTVTSPGRYGDFSQVHDYQTAVNTVMEAQLAFESLSARLRYRFDNDPGKFLAFVHDQANRDEAIQLGLIEPPPREPKPSAEGGIVSGDEPDSAIEAKPKSGPAKPGTPSPKATPEQ